MTEEQELGNQFTKIVQLETALLELLRKVVGKLSEGIAAEVVLEGLRQMLRNVDKGHSPVPERFATFLRSIECGEVVIEELDEFDPELLDQGILLSWQAVASQFSAFFFREKVLPLGALPRGEALATETQLVADLLIAVRDVAPEAVTTVVELLSALKSDHNREAYQLLLEKLAQ